MGSGLRRDDNREAGRILIVMPGLTHLRGRPSYAVAKPLRRGEGPASISPRHCLVVGGAGGEPVFFGAGECLQGVGAEFGEAGGVFGL